MFKYMNKCKRCLYEFEYTPYYEFKPSENELYVECHRKCKRCGNETTKGLPSTTIVKGRRMIIANLLDDDDIERYNIDIDKACEVMNNKRSKNISQQIIHIKNSNVSINSNKTSQNEVIDDVVEVNSEYENTETDENASTTSIHNSEQEENDVTENDSINETFHSPTAFMKLILNNEINIEFIELYFIPNECYVSNFGHDVAKPIALLIKYKNNERVKTFKYNDMIQYLSFIPKISLKRTNSNYIHKHKQMQKIVINSKLIKCSTYEYYNYDIQDVDNIAVINILKAAMTPEDRKTTVNDWN